MSELFVRLSKDASEVDQQSKEIVAYGVQSVEKAGINISKPNKDQYGALYGAMSEGMAEMITKRKLDASTLTPQVIGLLRYCVDQVKKENELEGIVCSDPLEGMGITFDEVAGQTVVKDELRTNYIYPFAFPLLFPTKSQGILLYGSPGSGKCLAPDERVLAYDGSTIRAEDVEVGDLLMGDDSKPRRVLSTCTGVDQMFRIIPSQGESFVVNAPHILTLRDSKSTSGHSIDIPLHDYIRKPIEWKKRHRGYRVGVDWPENRVPVDPYVVGLWIAHYSSNPQDVERAILDMGLEPSRAGRTELIGGLRVLEQYGEKRVAGAYRINSRAIRMEVLAGFLDMTHYLKGIQSSRRCSDLRDDIIFLARSLGIFATVLSDKQELWEGIDITHRGWGVRFSKAGLSEVPTRLVDYGVASKEELREDNEFSFHVRPLGNGKYCGFTIDGNRRFLLKDFTVTHNTMLARAATAELGSKVAFYAPSPGELRGKYEGETEKNIAKVFACAQRELDSTSKEFAIIFIDEFDSLAGAGREDDAGMRRSVNSFLQAMDGIKSQPDVSVIAATNFPDSIDEAVLRRFTSRIFVGQPDREAREWLVRASISDAFSSPGVDRKEVRRGLIVGYDDENKPIWDASAISNIELHNNGICGSEETGYVTSSLKSLLISDDFISKLADLLGPNDEGKGLINKIEVRKQYVDPDGYANKAPLFGYSASDISKMMAIAIQGASLRALQGAFRAEKFGGKTYYVADRLESDKAKFVALRDVQKDYPDKELLNDSKRKRLLNFALCENDIKKAMVDYPPTVKNSSYIDLLLYKNGLRVG